MVGWLVGCWLVVVVFCCFGFVVFGWFLLALVVEVVLEGLKPRMFLLVVVG